MSNLVFKLGKVEEINNSLDLSITFLNEIRELIRFVVNEMPKDFVKKDMVISLSKDFKEIRNDVRSANQFIKQGRNMLIGYGGELDRLFSKINKDSKKVYNPKLKYKQYVIQPGDTLWSIAEKYLGDGSRYQELVDYNQIENPDFIYAGDSIEIPERDALYSRGLSSRSSFANLEPVKEIDIFEQIKGKLAALVNFKLIKERVNKHKLTRDEKWFSDFKVLDNLEDDAQDRKIHKKSSQEFAKVKKAGLKVSIENLLLEKMTVLSSPQNGAAKTYMDYNMITDKSSPQYDFIVRNKNVKPDERGLLRDEYGFIGVALGSYFDGNKIGTRYIIELKDNKGKTKLLPVVKVEQKADIHTNEEDHYYHNVDKSVIEFVVDDALAGEAFKRPGGTLIAGGNFNNIPEFEGEITRIWKVDGKSLKDKSRA